MIDIGLTPWVTFTMLGRQLSGDNELTKPELESGDLLAKVIQLLFVNKVWKG